MKNILVRALLAFGLLYLVSTETIDYVNTSNTRLAHNTLTIIGAQGGGTGVILESSDITSSVLTNKHVCGVIKNMGGVRNDEGVTFSIISFKESQVHDLCQIIVSGNLQGHTKLASRAPAAYDTAIVAGHPHLMPTVINRGHFTQKTLITVSGGKPGPVEAQAVSVVIGPGSSGSAVYNSSGELAGLVFAGRGDIGFGFIVPYEYLAFFLNEELAALPEQVQTPEAPQLDFFTRGKSSDVIYL